MEECFQKELRILPAQCGESAVLSMTGAFDLFMDLAAEHAEALGIGGKTLLKRSLFFVAVRTHIRLYAPPEMLSFAVARTWPRIPGKRICERCSTLHSGETLLASAKTEWALMNTETHTASPASGIYPETLVLSDRDNGIAFSRLPRDFSEAQHVADIPVRSTDLDFGHHMNNVAYVRAVLGALAPDELSAVTGAEFCYHAPCFYGETLTLLRKENTFFLLHPDQKIAVLARLEKD